MFKFVAFALLVVFTTGTSARFWRECLNVRGPDHIETPMCDATRCFATRGQLFLANITLSSPVAHHELITENIAWIRGVETRLPMDYPHDNGCNNLFVNGVRHRCPTIPNVRHVWRVAQPIPRFLPTFQNTRVRYILRDRGTIVGCVEFTASLV